MTPRTAGPSAVRLAALAISLSSIACTEGASHPRDVSTGLAAALPSEPAPPSAAEALVTTYLAAFNSHSADRLAALLSENVEVIYVDQSGASTVGTSGREAMRNELAAYFQQFPDVRSEIANKVAFSGRFLSYSEHVTWTHEGAARSQSSLTVLEQVDGKIRRVWYYPG